MQNISKTPLAKEAFMSSEFSDYIIYVDESGDHSLEVVYEEHPIFVLALCIFKKNDYAKIVAPSICSLKFDFWGHDSIILHSHKIRKQKDDFSILANLPTMQKFMGRLNDLISMAPFTIISTIIDKRQLKNRYSSPQNPYPKFNGFLEFLANFSNRKPFTACFGFG